MELKAKILEFGEFNGWKGYVDMYFTKKELREIARLCGIKAKEIENYTIKEVYTMIH